MSLFDLEDEAVAPPRNEVTQSGASITFGQNKLTAGNRASVVGDVLATIEAAVEMQEPIELQAVLQILEYSA
jgi:hypothetical protein